MAREEIVSATLDRQETPMSEQHNRLNIDRAREALAQARAEQTGPALRSPRPADLSRLAESEARRQTIDSHAGQLREQLRERLDLGAYRGSSVSTSQLLSGVMSAPVCDADVCMPVHPALKRVDDTPSIPVETAPVNQAVVENASAQIDVEPLLVAPAEDDAVSTPEQMSRAKPQKARRKFLGLF